VWRLLTGHAPTLAGRVFFHQVAIIVVLVGCALFAAYLQAGQTNLGASRDRVLAVAESVAATPTVREALSRPDPSAVLQPFANRVQLETGTDFVVIMTVDGIRYTHPNQQLIGGRFVGTIAPAAAGRSFTETYAGSLGPSVRAVVPIDDGGTVRGLVAVGITVTAVDRRLHQQIPLLLGAAVAALLLAGAGYWLVNRWLRRATHDLGPAELSRMYEFYDAVLHAVREGLLLLDRAGRLQMANDEAYRLLALPEEAAGRRIDAVGLPVALGKALVAGEERTDELHLSGDRILVVSQAVASWKGAILGTVVTLRDHTELRALTSELDSMRGLADSLHAQAHEAANHLHTVVSLIELGRAEQALEYATAELAVAQQLTDRVIGSVAEPVLAALLLGKAAEASERGIELTISEDICVPVGAADPRDLVTILGNLIDNAIDAAQSEAPPRWVHVAAEITVASNGRDSGHDLDGGRDVVFRVSDSGGGLDPEDVVQAFQRGWSSKPADGLPSRGIGLALVAQAVHRYGGRIEVTRARGAVFTVRLPMQSDPPINLSEVTTPVVDIGEQAEGRGVVWTGAQLRDDGTTKRRAASKP
jgi:two-component system CitB family sensor kinase